MARAVVIGNSGGGKSVLARRLASQIDCTYVEIDAVLWQPGWRLTPAERYDAEHARLIAGERWIIDGLGRQNSIPQRLSRSTHIVLIDLPLWMHFWLAAERQVQWATGRIEHPPANSATMPPTEALFRTIWEVDQTWMPEIRAPYELEGAAFAGSPFAVHELQTPRSTSAGTSVAPESAQAPGRRVRWQAVGTIIA